MVQHLELLLIDVLGVLDAAGPRLTVDSFVPVYGALGGPCLASGC